ncbi:MAG: rhodanese-like domain-containing protein [Muriicola sp.]|nr:rhodanese-like domain-containing protein [Muriicola sp.]
MKRTWLLPFFLLVFIGCGQVKQMPIEELTAKDLKNAELVDVRTPEEYMEGHMDNAINIDWYDPEFISKFSELPKNKTVYIYCKKGGRSAQAAKVLDSIGYSVIDLLGGYDVLQAQNTD